MIELLLSAILAFGPLPTIVIKKDAAAAEIVDWTPSFIAVWRMENNNSWPNESGTTCGSDCDMSETGTVVQNTTSYQEGSASQDFVDGDGDDYLSCVNGAGAGECNELAISGSVSFGGWADINGDTTQRLLSVRASSNTGYDVERIAAGDKPRCRIGDGSDLQLNIAGNNVMQTGDGWVHWACVHDDAADTIEIFVDGTGSGSPTTQQDMAATSDTPVRIGSATATDHTSDEVWVFDGVLTDAEICRICSCGVDGSGCACSDATTYSDTGLNATVCNPGGTPCTLPSCTAAAP